MTGYHSRVTLIDGSVKEFHVAKIDIDSPFLSGEIQALCMPKCLFEVVIGNIPGARAPNDPDLEWMPKDPAIQTEVVQNSNHSLPENEQVELNCEGHVNQNEPKIMAVETRAQVEQKGKCPKPLIVTDQIPNVSPEEFKLEQERDQTLKHLWEKVKVPDDKKSKFRFIFNKGLLYRQNKLEGQVKNPVVLVVPSKFRLQIMTIAHDSLLSGHLGINNTLKKLQSQFYWPGVTDDANRFCRSCDICQKTIDKGRVTKVPLGRMPVMETPYQRIAVDLIGPLNPPSERGHRYILTIIDYATRYCDALPLKTISTVEVAECLLQVFCRVGVPLEILSDLGTQFVSDLMKEISRLLSIKGLVYTRYHPICNGLVEKYNGLIKKILCRMCSEQPKQWDRYLPALLFALREIPSSSLGYSLFELLYGRHVRGPMEILRELWTNEDLNTEQKDEYQYVIEL